MSYFESSSSNKSDDLMKSLLSNTLSNIIRTSSDKSFRIHAMARLNVNTDNDVERRVGELIKRQQDQSSLKERGERQLSDEDSFDVLQNESLLVAKSNINEIKCLDRALEIHLKLKEEKCFETLEKSAGLDNYQETSDLKEHFERLGELSSDLKNFSE